MAQHSVVTLPQFSYWDINGALNYQHTTVRQGEMFNLAYRIATTDHHRVDNIATHDSLATVQMFDAYDKDEQLNFIEHTFEADWTRPLSKGHTLDVGAKYITRSNDSKSGMKYYNVNPVFLPSLGQTETDFRHTTNVAALYTEYRLNIKKWGLRAGLRYEYSHLKSEDRKNEKNNFSANLNDWVPTFGVSYRISDFSMLKFNYSRRIQRPGIEYLNPYVEYQITQKNYGNPNLKSAGSNSTTLSYQLTTNKLTLMPSFNLVWVNGEIEKEMFTEQMEYEGKQMDVVNNTYANNVKQLSVSPSLYIQWQATNTTSIITNASVTFQQLKHKTQNLELSRWGYSASAQVRQKLPWELTAELRGFIHNGGLRSLYAYHDKAYYLGSFTLRRDFLKEKRLSVALTAQIHSRYPSAPKFVQGDMLGWNKVYAHYNKSAELSVSYRFGSLNTTVKKTSKKIQNDDQIGGISQ
ncbi:MAG: TonB-dependent receptor [Prevotella sp.]|nr:TonB-dependent receptor [Prevotella sp.]